MSNLFKACVSAMSSFIKPQTRRTQAFDYCCDNGQVQ